MDQTPISTPDQRKSRKEKAGQRGVGGDLINSIKGNKSIMRGRPKGQQVVTIVTYNDQEGILRPFSRLSFAAVLRVGFIMRKDSSTSIYSIIRHLFNYQPSNIHLIINYSFIQSSII